MRGLALYGTGLVTIYSCDIYTGPLSPPVMQLSPANVELRYSRVFNSTGYNSQFINGVYTQDYFWNRFIDILSARIAIQWCNFIGSGGGNILLFSGGSQNNIYMIATFVSNNNSPLFYFSSSTQLTMDGAYGGYRTNRLIYSYFTEYGFYFDTDINADMRETSFLSTNGFGIIYAGYSAQARFTLIVTGATRGPVANITSPAAPDVNNNFLAFTKVES